MPDVSNAVSFSAWAVSVALLAVRLSVAVALAPAFAAFGIPASARITLVFAVAAIAFVYRTPAPSAAVLAANPALLVPAVVAEVFIGALLGLGVHVVLAALALAGKIMDVQIGFALGSVFDPITRTSANVLGSLASLTGVVLFFLSNTHIALAQMIARSIDMLPLGEFPALNDPLQPLMIAGAMFAVGVALAAPVTIALLLTDIAVGVASRNMPQINVFLLAIPAKVIIAYTVLALSVRGWAPLLDREFGRIALWLEAR